MDLINRLKTMPDNYMHNPVSGFHELDKVPGYCLTAIAIDTTKSDDNVTFVFYYINGLWCIRSINIHEFFKLIKKPSLTRFIYRQRRAIQQTLCGLALHSWTCAVEQGIRATKYEMEDIKGFWRYATMYCARCGYVSKLSGKKKES